jgi:hypothetical protein
LPDGGVTEISSTAGCSFVLPIPPFTVPAFAEASARSGYEFLSVDLSEEIPAGSLWAYSSVSARAHHPPFDPELSSWSEYSDARAFAQLSLRATTAGPVRPGLVDLTYSFGWGCEGNTEVQGEGRIGDVFLKFLDPGCPGFHPTVGDTFPFILGQPFDIHLSTFVRGVGGYPYGGNSDASFDVFFYLRELDGTAVDLLLDSEGPVPIPEPSTLLLLASALSLLALQRAIALHLRKTLR